VTTPLDATVLKMQRDSLRDALLKVLDTHNLEAKAAASYRSALENFCNPVFERNVHAKAMRAASDAEREAKVLLMTIKWDTDK
jgi:uncharacterized membrane protein